MINKNRIIATYALEELKTKSLADDCRPIYAIFENFTLNINKMWYSMKKEKHKAKVFEARGAILWLLLLAFGMASRYS